MDPEQFDKLVARLAAGPSRRDALKGLVGGALASVGVTSVASAKDKKGKRAKNRKDDDKDKGKGKGKDRNKNQAGGAGAENGKKRRRRKNKKCKLQPGQTRCSKKVCVDLQTNIANCGFCGRACPTGNICRNGSCVSGT